MAKRKNKKKSGRRRSRVGAMALKAENPIVKYGSIAAGFFLANQVNGGIDKLVGTGIDSKIVAGGQVGVGALLVFKKGKKSLIGTVAGGIMLGSGAKRAMTAFGIGSHGINGYQAVPAVNGYQAVPAVNGYASSKRIGYPGGLGDMHVSATPGIGRGLMRSGVGR